MPNLIAPLRPSDLYNVNFYTGKTSLYWICPLLLTLNPVSWCWRWKNRSWNGRLFFHYGDITRACHFMGHSTVRLKKLIQADNKEAIQSMHDWPFVLGIHQWLVESLHKVPMIWKMCPIENILSQENLTRHSSLQLQYTLEWSLSGHWMFAIITLQVASNGWLKKTSYARRFQHFHHLYYKLYSSFKPTWIFADFGSVLQMMFGH